MPETIGDHLLKKRIGMGLRQVEVARLLGVSRATTGNWEAGHYRPTGGALMKVIGFLGYDPEDAKYSKTNSRDSTG